MSKKVRHWFAIVDELDKDDLVSNGFPYEAVVECAGSFMIDRPDKGFGTFDFCMGAWIGWRQTNKAMKKRAWKEAKGMNSVKAVGA
jgi:hypothetical protein